jgi:hypothetical protein
LTTAWGRAWNLASFPTTESYRVVAKIFSSPIEGGHLDLRKEAGKGNWHFIYSMVFGRHKTSEELIATDECG